LGHVDLHAEGESIVGEEIKGNEKCLFADLSSISATQRWEVI